MSIVDGGGTGDLHGEGGIGSISGSGEDGNNDGSNAETDTQTNSKSDGNTGCSGLDRSVGNAGSSISIANSTFIDDKDTGVNGHTSVEGGGIAQVQDAESAVRADERSIDATVDSALDGGAVVILAILGADGRSEGFLGVDVVATHLSGGISRFANVLGAEVSVIAVNGSVYQLMEAALICGLSGHPIDVAEIKSASVVISTGGIVGGSAISIDLIVSVGIGAPGSESSADVVLASVSVALFKGALTSEGSLCIGEASILGRSPVVASELLAGSVHTSFGFGQIVVIHIHIGVGGVGGIVIVLVDANKDVGLIGSLGLGIAFAVGESVHAINDRLIALVLSLVAFIDSASISVIATFVRDALAIGCILVALSSGGIASPDLARQVVIGRSSAAKNSLQFSIDVNIGFAGTKGNVVGIDDEALVLGCVAIRESTKIGRIRSRIGASLGSENPSTARIARLIIAGGGRIGGRVGGLSKDTSRRAVALPLNFAKITILTLSGVVNFDTSGSVGGVILDRAGRNIILIVGVADSGSTGVIRASGSARGAAISDRLRISGSIVGPSSNVGADSIETSSFGAIRGDSLASERGVASGNTLVLRSLTTEACQSSTSIGGIGLSIKRSAGNSILPSSHSDGAIGNIGGRDIRIAGSR